MKKQEKEWTVNFPWGKVAMVSWGNPMNPPILMVHGFMDSAATFIPLVELLPDTYYYVGFDKPGHGKSSPFPKGVLVSQLTLVEVVRGVVDHMKWESFVYISHSMGFIIGMLYNHLYPGKITKMIHFDPERHLSLYYFPHHKPQYWYLNYENYYNVYSSWPSAKPKTMTYNEAIALIVRNRYLTHEKAEAVLSRSLVPVGEGKYRLSWDPRMKNVMTAPLSEDTLYTIITEHAPRILIVEASDNLYIPGGDFSKNILDKCKKLPNFSSVTVSGGHDVHITNPERIVPHILEFLKDVNKLKKCNL